MRPRYRHRAIDFYPVTEDEIIQISGLNQIATLFFSAGSLFLGLGFDLIKDTSLAEDIPTQTAEILSWANPGSMVLSLVCYAIAGFASYRRGGFVKKILNNSFED